MAKLKVWSDQLNKWVLPSVDASSVIVDDTNLDNNLSGIGSSLQDLMEAIDDLPLGGSGSAGLENIFRTSIIITGLDIDTAALIGVASSLGIPVGSGIYACTDGSIASYPGGQVYGFLDTFNFIWGLTDGTLVVTQDAGTPPATGAVNLISVYVTDNSHTFQTITYLELTGGLAIAQSLVQTRPLSGFWYFKDKEAIFAGKGITSWDTSLIGNGSLNFGTENTTSGANSIAIGAFNNALGDNSICIGKSATANGDNSLSIGNEVNSATAETNSIAICGSAGSFGLAILASGIDNCGGVYNTYVGCTDRLGLFSTLISEDRYRDIYGATLGLYQITDIELMTWVGNTVVDLYNTVNGAFPREFLMPHDSIKIIRALDGADLGTYQVASIDFDNSTVTLDKPVVTFVADIENPTNIYFQRKGNLSIRYRGSSHEWMETYGSYWSFTGKKIVCGLGVESISSTSDITNMHQIILASGDITLTLPSANGNMNKEYVIKKTDSNSTTVTIDSYAGTIDSATSVSITSQYGQIRVVSDNSNWWII